MATAVRDFSKTSVDLNGRSILITGGTGSFGQAFVAAVLSRWKPRKLIVFSRDEAKQYEMAQKFPMTDASPVRYFIGDVRDASRLDMAMHDVDIVIHAAALKHVPAAEYNPFECVRTNIYGAENVVQAALRNGVSKVVALSTDKAAGPVNLYGASKLASDKIFVAANYLRGSRDTRFSVVRYGNVIGSRGSVVPFFRGLLTKGATELPVTDPRMTRFWITLQQGVDFVLSCLDGMRGGEIFVPKLPSMRIVDLVTAMAPEAATRITGIRAGEKLHETMISADDSRSCVAFPDRYVIEPSLSYWNEDLSWLREPGAHRVVEGFHYASDANDEWLSVEATRDLLAGLRL